MALHSYGGRRAGGVGGADGQVVRTADVALWLWPIQLWPYTVMAETVMAHGSPPMRTAQSGRRGQSARPKESQATGGWGSMACTVMAYIVMAYTVMARYSYGPT